MKQTMQGCPYNTTKCHDNEDFRTLSSCQKTRKNFPKIF